MNGKCLLTKLPSGSYGDFDSAVCCPGGELRPRLPYACNLVMASGTIALLPRPRILIGREILPLATSYLYHIVIA